MAENRYEQVQKLLEDWGASKAQTALIAAFVLLDVNSDGLVSQDEFMLFFDSIGESEFGKIRVRQAFACGDRNKDGFLDEAEFITAIEVTARYDDFPEVESAYFQTKDPVHLKAMFQILDLNGDGLISREENLAYYEYVNNVEFGKGQVPMMFRVGDVNRDGLLDEAEYVGMYAMFNRYDAAKRQKNQNLQLSPTDLEIKRLLIEYFDYYQDWQKFNPTLFDPIFALLDADHDGKLTKEDLLGSILTRWTSDAEAMAVVIMATADLDDDQMISLEEFRTFLNSGKLIIEFPDAS
jgi:Ca2+-binding EF-hand superfamily protein